ncbi:MAG: S8 family serine peptidase [Bacteroidetes bacterium]|uniref:S8 family serine peptidase n=1 Tax=Candidatus Cryptobacteroides merdavium TaxID=2840769 RepID=A0A9D9HCI4_9BACT|nr:S8 family serine peptidase [Candidatus Cryptobacteroides merdavium]
MIYRRLLIPALAVSLCACTSELYQEPSQADGTLSGRSEKICNTSAGAEDGMLVVQFDEETADALGRNLPEPAGVSAVPRSGIESLDDMLLSLDVTSLERVFPIEGRNEARKRAAGLHRWFLLKFDAAGDIDMAADRLAGMSQVSKIQFNTRLYRNFDGRAYPFESGVHGASRAMVTADFNDPNLFWQWHYINNADQAVATEAVAGADINVAEAWKLTAGDPRVIVAIVDGGVKYTHPDLAANMWVNEAELNGEPGVDDDGNGYVDDIYGYNFAENSSEITWDSVADGGHGTHVAGTVAAVNNNGIGVCGVAGGTGNGDGVRLMSCQIFAQDQNANDVMTGRAIMYAADMGASIIQCSYGYEAGTVRSDNNFATYAPATKAAIDYFVASENTCEAVDGGIVIFSAGNEATPMASYPGAYRDYVAVTSFGPDFLPAYYTNFGAGCNIAAPGGETAGFSGGERAGVLSTLCSETNNGEDYGYMQGTSMACPHVSGVAALGLSYALKKGLHFSRDEFVSMLLTSVNEIDSRFVGEKNTSGTINLENYVGKMGTGAVDAYQLLMQIEGTPCLKVPLGSLQMIELTDYFGGGAAGLTYTGLDISEEDMQKLGIETAPTMYEGRLMIRCTKPGVARISVSAIAGGDTAGSGIGMGGMEISKEFAIIARETGAANGGWL